MDITNLIAENNHNPPLSLGVMDTFAMRDELAIINSIIDADYLAKLSRYFDQLALPAAFAPPLTLMA